MTKFQVVTILTCHTMDGQTHTIGKAVRPLFADPVTIMHAFIPRIWYYKFLNAFLDNLLIFTMRFGGRWEGTKSEMSCHGFPSYSPHLSTKLMHGQSLLSIYCSLLPLIISLLSIEDAWKTCHAEGKPWSSSPSLGMCKITIKEPLLYNCSINLVWFIKLYNRVT